MNAVQRKTKDLLIDCYNLWQKWLDLNAKSMNVLEQCGNMRILLLDPKASAVADRNFDLDSIKVEMSKLCDSLKDAVDEFERIVVKFDKICSSFEGLKSLTDEQVTVPALDHLDAVASIRDQLKAEMHCKKSILETVPFAKTRQVVQTCLAAWVHQPYLDESRIQFLITAMTADAGLL